MYGRGEERREEEEEGASRQKKARYEMKGKKKKKWTGEETHLEILALVLENVKKVYQSLREIFVKNTMLIFFLYIPVALKQGTRVPTIRLNLSSVVPSFSPHGFASSLICLSKLFSFKMCVNSLWFILVML